MIQDMSGLDVIPFRMDVSLYNQSFCADKLVVGLG